MTYRTIQLVPTVAEHAGQAGNAGEIFSESHENSAQLRRRHRQAFQDPGQADESPFLQAPGDVFSETDLRMMPRRRKAYQPTSEDEHGILQNFSGDQFSECQEQPTLRRARHRGAYPPPVEIEMGQNLPGDVFSDADPQAVRKKVSHHKSYQEPVETEKGLLQNFKGDVFSDPMPYAVTKRIKHRAYYIDPVDCEFFHSVFPGDCFSETHYNPAAFRRQHKRTYPEPDENEQGLLQNYPGDCFSETDLRMVPRRKRTYQDPAETEHDRLPNFPGDVFSDTDIRFIKRKNRTWDDFEQPDAFAPFTGQPPFDDGPFSDNEPWRARHYRNRMRAWLQPGMEEESLAVGAGTRQGAFQGAKLGFLTIQPTRSAVNFTIQPTREGSLLAQ